MDCSLRAVQNLYVSVGLKPPPVEELLEFMRRLCERGELEVTPEEMLAQGLTVENQAVLVQAFGFPSIVAFASIPANLTARDVFPVLQAGGFGVLFQYTQRIDGRVLTHAVVLHSCEPDHIEVLDSQPHNFYNRMLPAWEIEGEALERLKDAVRGAMEAGWAEHGTITRLPYDTMDFRGQIEAPPAAFDNFSEARVPLGINRWFLMTFPVK